MWDKRHPWFFPMSDGATSSLMGKNQYLREEDRLSPSRLRLPLNVKVYI
jgi:hypothetical protein